MTRVLRWGLPVLLCVACGSKDPVADGAAKAERMREVALLVDRLDEPAVVERIVAIGEAGPILELTRPPHPDPVRYRACAVLRRMKGPEAAARVAEMTAEALAATEPGAPDRLRGCLTLGRIGGDEARDRLLAMLGETSGDPLADGPVHLYAAAGLTLRSDPGTAVDLLLSLSTINPNDNVMALAAEEANSTYFTVDGQICEALLAMGLWDAEEELIGQLRRRDRVRVMIDANALLRRYTGLELPFRYNGAYAARDEDADAWAERLRATRAERRRAHPFDASNAHFQERCAEIVGWLGKMSVNNRLIAQKVVLRLGHAALPQLRASLESDNAVAQRQAALMMGRIGEPEAAPALREALSLRDDDARAETIAALRAIGDRGALAGVRERLTDGDAEVRAAAAAFLGALGEPEQDRERVRAALEAERAPGTRTALLCALLDLGDRTAAEPLLRVFREGEQIERGLALDAIERAAGKRTGATALSTPEERAAAAATMEAWFR